MNYPEALAVVGRLVSYFRGEMTDETAVLWAEALLDFDEEDGKAAAKIAGESLQFIPSLADFIDEVEMCKLDRYRRGHPALREPDPDGVNMRDALNADPELRERWEKLIRRAVG